MKTLLTFTLTVLIVTTGFGQVHLMNNATNNTTVTSCGTSANPLLVYDSGGPNGNYSNNENYTLTFCPNTAGKQMRLTFTNWQIGGIGDNLIIYDGTTATGNILGIFDNTTPPSTVQATAANAGGCITLQWTSSSTVTGAGFAGKLTCQNPCQTVIAELAAASPAPVPTNNGYIDICPGEQVTFIGAGSYPYNNTFYSQSDATSTFLWTIEGQQYTGSVVNHTFNNPGGSRVQLEITDVSGCTSLNILNQRVRVAPDPYFNGTNIDLTTICPNDTINLQGVFVPVQEDFVLELSRGDSIPLPDVPPTGIQSYTTSLVVMDFFTGQTLTNANQIEICLNIEHSYLGDLDIEISCPNNQTVFLHQYSGGGGTYLGYPNENDDASIVVGSGIEYCWNSTTTNPTLVNASVNFNYTTPYNAPPGFPSNTINAGTYSPAQSFSGLIGCPLNGSWTITVTDNLQADNGYIFDWGITFAQNLYPSIETFTPMDSLKGWLSNPTFISNNGDTIMTAAPTMPGNVGYVFSTITDWGCAYDTIISVQVLPFTNPACINCDSIYSIVPMNDTTICAGTSVPLSTNTQSNISQSTFTYTSGEAVVTNNTVEAELNVTGIVPSVLTANSIVSVCVDAEHVFPADFDMFLIAPSGQILELSTDNGGFFPAGNAYSNTCFTPTATNPINFATPPFNGTFAPEVNFNLLNGAAINGVWKLRIKDDGTYGVDGILNSWSITFNQTHNINHTWTPTTGLSCTNCPNPTASPTTTTQYIVNVNDNFGCVKTDTVVVNVIQPLPAPTVNCGNTTGTTIEITWTAIPNAISYQVNIDNTGWIPANGTLSHLLTGLLPSQTVIFRVRAVQGACNSNNLVGLISCTTEPCSQNISLDSLQMVSCYGGTNGIAYISTTGSQPPFNFTLNGTTTQTNGTFTNLPIGNYQVVAVDGFTCADTVNFVITQPDTMTITPNITNNICFGESNGTIAIAATGGTSPYSFAWSNGGITNTISNLPIGNYTVTVTDANGCQKSATFSISQPTDIALNIGKTNVLCFGGNTGSAFVTATGGTGTYNYTWNSTPTQNVDSAVGLPVGVYEVIVSDANGCLDSIATIINQPAPLASTISATDDASCFGFNDGFATVAVSGGTLNYTYNWSTIPPQDSSTAVGLTAGTYYVTATDANGCTIIDTAIINQPTEITMTFTTAQVTCFGLSDGSATAFPTGGSGSVYTYAWNTTPTQNLQTATNIPGGFFEVTVTDSTGCLASDTIYVYAPVILDLDTLFATPTLCYGSNEGTAGVQTSGGTGQKTYVWNTNPISNGAVQTNLFAGVYSVTATDQQGCQLIDSVEVTQPNALAATFAADSLTCFQSFDGSATASITGGTMNYFYNWDNFQTGTQASGLPSGFTYLTVTDANNCVLVDSVFIPEPLPVTAVLTSAQVSCNGNSDGTATATPSGGTLPYTYLWADNQTTQTAINLGGGTITVTITDSYGCLGSDSVFILELPTLTTTDTSFQVSCAGFGDGTAIAIPSGGAGNYTYQWQNLAQTVDTVSGLAGGIYHYTVTDNNNCTVSDSVFVFEPTPLATTMSSTPVSCFGDIDGSATVNVSGGTIPYFYTWANNPQTSATVFGLAAGFNYVTVTDLYNCQIIDAVLVTTPTPVTATAVSTPPFCFNGSNGTATATGAGGVGNYTYNWIGLNQTTATATGLSVGTYTVAVSDSNNCSTVTTVIVSQPTPLAMIPSILGVSCFGNADGAVGVTPVGGVGPYSYQWSTSPTANLSSITGLTAGTYIVTITDFNGCTLVDSFLVPQPAMLNLTSGSTPVSCHSGSDGSAFVNVSGGSSPYNYNWNPAATNTNTLNNLPAGNYSVTVTDNYGCQIIENIAVTEPTALNLALSQQPASCFGVNDGQAYVVITGGTLDYTILWNSIPAGVTDSIAYLKGDKTYIVTVTDGNGCIAIDSIFVDEPDKITAQVIITDETCFTSNDGTATAAIIGGTAPFTYTWGANTNNQTTQTATNLPTGIYTVLISDANNCNAQATGVVNQPDSLQLRLSKVDVACHGDATGLAIASAIGGVGGYTFSWQTNNGIQTGDSATNLVAGVHAVVTVTDANGCQTTDQIIIEQPDAPLAATTASENVDCYGDENGRIEVTTTGGTTPYEYIFENNSPTTTNIFIGLEDGDYNIVIQDANGCTTSAQVTITQPDEIIVDLGADILLEEGEQAILEADITNGVAPFIYVWQPADSTLSCPSCPTTTVSNLLFDKRYDLIITDANGCTGEDFIMVRTKKVKDIFVANGFTPNNDGNNDKLYVQGNPFLAQVKTFRVFDRWGELVFESTDNQPNDDTFGWDGTMKNQPLSSGMFVWVAEIEFKDGQVKVYQGSTFLIR
jgi:gliding motility-associated-like protein